MIFIKITILYSFDCDYNSIYFHIPYLVLMMNDMGARLSSATVHYLYFKSNGNRLT